MTPYLRAAAQRRWVWAFDDEPPVVVPLLCDRLYPSGRKCGLTLAWLWPPHYEGGFMTNEPEIQLNGMELRGDTYHATPAALKRVRTAGTLVGPRNMRRRAAHLARNPNNQTQVRLMLLELEAFPRVCCPKCGLESDLLSPEDVDFVRKLPLAFLPSGVAR